MFSYLSLIWNLLSCSTQRVHRGALLVALMGVLLFSQMDSAHAQQRRQSRGNEARVGGATDLFEQAKVAVITNRDGEMGLALTTRLLEGARAREVRTFAPDAWRNLYPKARREYVAVFLIDRSRLRAGFRVPATCPADGDVLHVEAVRPARDGGAYCDVILSAPDVGWLRRAIDEFRALREPPRRALRRPVVSLAVRPMSLGAHEAAAQFVRQNQSDTLAPFLWESDGEASRCVPMRELCLLDRSSEMKGDESGTTRPMVPPPSSAAAWGTADTIAWRERKAELVEEYNVGDRVVLSAPNAALLSGAMELYARQTEMLLPPGFGVVTTLSSARDLRGVRRVVVAGVRGSAGGADLAKRLATVTATKLRTLDAFEVLERAGLNEILAEIALGQAGITQARDRARVRRLAAADALLVVEVTDVSGRTEHSVAQERVTPKAPPPPRRPAEPMRARLAMNLPGRANDDPLVRSLADILLTKVSGKKSGGDYRNAMDLYERETLPDWQARVREHERGLRERTIVWRQEISARSRVRLSGSVRLVDLADGLVLWETPFAAELDEELPKETKGATSTGEDSVADFPKFPEASDAPTPALLARAADEAVGNAMVALARTSLLPSNVLPASALANPLLSSSPESGGNGTVNVATATAGRVLDVDSDGALIGLGAGDGLRVGDALVVTLESTAGTTAAVKFVRLIVTKVRPRTCDAEFAANAPAVLRARVAVGLTARKAATAAGAK